MVPVSNIGDSCPSDPGEGGGGGQRQETEAVDGGGETQTDRQKLVGRQDH